MYLATAAVASSLVPQQCPSERRRAQEILQGSSQYSSSRFECSLTHASPPPPLCLKTQSICLSFLMILIFLFVFTTNVAGGTENKVCNEIVGLEISCFNFFSLFVFHSSCELALRHLLKSLLLSLLCEEGFHDSWPPEGCSLPHDFSLPSGVFT